MRASLNKANSIHLS